MYNCFCSTIYITLHPVGRTDRSKRYLWQVDRDLWPLILCPILSVKVKVASDIIALERINCDIVGAWKALLLFADLSSSLLLSRAFSHFAD